MASRHLKSPLQEEMPLILQAFPAPVAKPKGRDQKVWEAVTPDNIQEGLKVRIGPKGRRRYGVVTAWTQSKVIISVKTFNRAGGAAGEYQVESRYSATFFSL